MKTSDNNSNQSNPNKGTSGTNTQYDKAQGNRGAQLNPNKTGVNNKSGGSNNGGNSKGGKR